MIVIVLVPLKMFHLPRTTTDWIMFFIFWLGGLWTLFYEYYFIMCSYHKDWNSYVIFHVAVAGFLALSIYTNMILIISSDVTTRSVSLSAVLPSDKWKYCDICQLSAPPRSHHCKLCNACILKRDHHCWFAGYCIGFSNHRYFICLAFYMSIAGVYANIYNWDFFLSVKGGFTWTTLPSLIAPHVGLMFGTYTFYEFFITIVSSTGFLVTIVFLWLLETQILQFVKGQVMHEKKKGINDYSLGLSNTFNEIFGSAGFWVFLCPLVRTKLPGDGTSFLTRDDKEK
ncbi:unnamed protein product [Lymnaea stagnalis]|uniref:Palmitoyltransferase n=1 Tax=Lymnaea stagnalis TaxID=6523 RepID=A0AAV2H1V2_LYMST